MDTTPNASPAKPATPGNGWVAGAAKAGAACLAAVAFCASAGAAPLPSEPSPGPTVVVGAAAAKMDVAEGMDIRGGASAKAGEALRQTLAPYKGLPPARIALVTSEMNKEGTGLQAGSKSRYDPDTGQCEIAMVIDPHGAATLASTMRSTMGVEPSASLAQRMGKLEILHELGHCSAHARGLPFEHPALSDAENKAIGTSLSGTPLGAIWDESYADSYALLKNFEGKPSGGKEFEQATRDSAILEGWRKMEREGHAHPSGSGLKIDYKRDEHITEKSIEELRSNPKRWLDESVPIERRAAQLASIGTLRAQKATDSPAELARVSLTLEGRTEVAMSTIAQAIAPIAILGASMAPDAKTFKTEISKIIRVSLPPDPTQAMALAASQSLPLSGIAYDAALAKKDDPAFLKSIDTNGFTGFGDDLMAQAKAKGLLSAALAKATPSERAWEAPLAKAWAKAEAAESASPSTVASAKEDNHRTARELQAAGDAKLDKVFHPDPPALKLGQWREGRPSATPAVLPTSSPKPSIATP